MHRAQLSRSSLDALLDPKSVAVMGGSPRHPVRRQLVANFADLRSPARVVAVNPNHASVDGVLCYPNLGAVPFVPDAVLIGLPAMPATEAIEQAAQLGVKAAVVLAGGFAETDKRGRGLQARVVRAARATGMAVIGPNCQGLINFWSPVALYLHAVHAYLPGAVALISQSGAITRALINSRMGVRWGYAVSTGNEAVVGAADLIGRWVDEERVKVICVFAETIRAPDAFFHECDRAWEAGKSVIVLKAARSDDAHRVAAAHTDALAQPMRLLDARFRRHHIAPVESLEELLACALTLQIRRPRATGLATVAGSGGAIELVLDEASRNRLSHPALSDVTVNAVLAEVDDPPTPRNPLDIWTGRPRSATGYARLLELVAADAGIGVIVCLRPDLNDYPTTYPASNTRVFLEAIGSVSRQTDTLLVVVDPVAGNPPATLVEAMLDGGVLVLSGIRTALGALAALIHSSEWPAPRHLTATPSASVSLEPTLRVLVGSRALMAIRDAKLSVARSSIARSEVEAAKAAKRIGFPVVLKVGRPCGGSQNRAQRNPHVLDQPGRGPRCIPGTGTHWLRPSARSRGDCGRHRSNHRVAGRS